MSQQNLSEDLFDLRKRERFLHEGVLTQEQVDAYLASLEDCADNAEISGVQMVSHGRSRSYVSAEGHANVEDEG
jgi:hypothetical protein